MRRPQALLKPLLASGVVALLSALPAPPVQAARAASTDSLPKIRVQDLHYGEVLFQFYAGNDFDALTELEAFEHWGRMPNHRHDAALLAGGLYLSLGIHNEAGKRFETLLGNDVPVGVRNRAWFYLAKVWYTRGYYDRSEQSLGRITGLLSPALEAERQHLLVNVLMRQNRFEEAAAHIAGWQGPPDWMAYARFNLGVALVRQNRMSEADPVLSAVGTMEVGGEELLALRDKANLALGYAWLQANNAANARVALERVRLSGPYATRALLGVGWADAQLGQFREALTPWLELHDRNLLDAAVQESFLAVPYAFSKLGANAQAADYYESAIKSFESEAGQIDESIVRIGEGQMLDDLLGADKQAQQLGWFWQLRQLPDAPQSRYLYALLADNDFQEGLKNYRDLGYLGDRLSKWDQSMDAFGAMIDTRERAYADRLPRTDALLASDRPAKFLAARAAVDARLTSIETGDDVAALGTGAEQKQWAKLRQLDSSLASATAADPESLQIERDKLKLMKGVLYWRLDSEFKQRDYSQRRALRALDAALNEAQNRWARVQRARGSVPTNTGEFAARIAALAARIAAMQQSLKDSAQQQNVFLQHLAQNELLAQKERLAAYQVQARFSLADIYDRASTGEPRKPAPAGDASEAPPAGDGAPNEAAPTDTAPSDTAPSDTAPSDTAPSDTAPAEPPPAGGTP